MTDRFETPSALLRTATRLVAATSLALPMLAVGCKSSFVDRGSYVADVSHRAASHDPRIRYLVLHYTALDAARSMSVLTTDEVSAHYLVPKRPLDHGDRMLEKPFVFALVPENERAWHAGVSHWQRASDLNDSSIGIEIINAGPLDHDRRTWDPFDDGQIDVITRLAQDIVARYDIPPTRVVGHADIAPQRKEDPGPVFPWERLARAGLGAWPDAPTVARYLAGRDPKLPTSICILQSKLAAYGYEVAVDGVLDDRTQRVLQAFQMHFRPRDYSGDPDAETDAIVTALLEKYPPRGSAPASDYTDPRCLTVLPPNEYAGRR
jgi:N-acetylmuramoyl-L-alanine amidase